MFFYLLRKCYLDFVKKILQLRRYNACSIKELNFDRFAKVIPEIND